MRLKIFTKAIDKIGQIWKKMASSSNYQKLNCTAIDPENERINDSVYTPSCTPTSVGSSEFSSAYISPDVTDFSPISWKQFKKEDDRQFDSIDISNIRVTMPPSDPWNDMKSTDDQDSLKPFTSFGSFNANLSALVSNGLDRSSYSTLPSDFAYSLLSNYNTTEYQFWKDFQSHEEMQQENLALDFESNGKTVDVTFNPRLSSTPVTNRTYDDEDYSIMPYLQGYFHNNFNVRFDDLHPLKDSNIKHTPVKPKVSKNKPPKKSLVDHCVFCKNNGADPAVYNSHKVIDNKGRCLCPVLRQYKCPICQADGDNAHTTKYCPKRGIITEDDMKKMNKRSNRRKSMRF